MSIEPVWVTADEAIAINARLMADTAEPHAVRDLGALEGALNRPTTYFQYEDVTEIHFLAGYLILAIGKAHAFEQGNKRTAWVAARLFIKRNGYRLNLDDQTTRVIAMEVEKLMEDERGIKSFIHLLGTVMEPT